MAILFFVLAALVYSVQGIPTQTDPGVEEKKSDFAVIAGVQNNDKKLLPPLIKKMLGFEDNINEALLAILPFLNFVMNTDSDASDDEDGSCSDEMIIQLVQDDSDTSQLTPADAADSTPADVTDSNPADVTDSNPADLTDSTIAPAPADSTLAK